MEDFFGSWVLEIRFEIMLYGNDLEEFGGTKIRFSISIRFYSSKQTAIRWFYQRSAGIIKSKLELFFLSKAVPTMKHFYRICCLSGLGLSHIERTLNQLFFKDDR